MKWGGPSLSSHRTLTYRSQMKRWFPQVSSGRGRPGQTENPVSVCFIADSILSWVIFKNEPAPGSDPVSGEPAGGPDRHGRGTVTCHDLLITRFKNIPLRNFSISTCTIPARSAHLFLLLNKIAMILPLRFFYLFSHFNIAGILLLWVVFKC